MALTNMHSDLRFDPFSGLCISLVSYIILRGSFISHLGVQYITLGCNNPVTPLNLVSTIYNVMVQ